jgi:hypothetical protein
MLFILKTLIELKLRSLRRNNNLVGLRCFSNGTYLPMFLLFQKWTIPPPITAPIVIDPKIIK